MTRLVNAVMVTTILTTVACDAPLDTRREVEPYGSLGAVIYREGCQRVAYTGQLAQKEAGLRTTVDVSGGLGREVCVQGAPAPSDAPEKLKAIQAHKNLLIATVDAILPDSFLDTLQGFLVALLPLADDGTMEQAIRSLGDLLQTMKDDPEFAPALARLAQRSGYRPTKTAIGLLHTVLEYPALDDVIDKLLGLIGPGGSAEAEWKQVLAALSRELRAAAPVEAPGDPERTLRLALNLFLSVAPDLGSGKPRPLVQRDFRGMALARTVNGQVQAPFVDQDGDGLADVDSMGRFVDAQGQPLAVPTPFPETGVADTAPRDAEGRALSAPDAGTTLYRYLDLDSTVIGGLTREAVSLMNAQKNITLGLLHGMSALLGPRTTRTKMYLDPAGGLIDAFAYEGYDVAQAPILDLLHAFVQILGDPNADATLQTVATLLGRHESQTTRLIKAMLDTADLGKQHPEAQVPETSTLYDDLMPLVQRILAVPGLAEDLLKALEDPHVKGFAPMLARLMVQRNRIDFNHSGGPDYNLTSNLDTVDPVDRSQPDRDYNRSLLQRIAHMIHDANGMQFCNKEGAKLALGPIPLTTYKQCELFKVDDLALLFVLNMASDSIRMDEDRYETTYSKASFREQIMSGTVKTFIVDNGVGDSLLEAQTGITGFTRFPMPKALTRSLFLRPNEQSSFLQNTIEPVRCRDGDLFTDVHDESIFAWETTLANNPSGFPNDTFYDAVRPLVDAFARHDECIARDQSGACTKTQNAAKIFVDLFAMLHTHWTSPNGGYFGKTYQSTSSSMPRFSYPDNLASYEPLLAEVLSRGDLVPAVIGLAPVINTINTDGTTGGAGIPVRSVLTSSAKYLFDPDAAKAAGVAYRSGQTSTTTSDGKRMIPQATPYYLLADAFAAKRAALRTNDPAKQAAWDSATSALVDELFTVEQPAAGQFRMKNRRVRAMTLILVDFLRGRLKTHAQKGDLNAWVQKQLTEDLTSVLGGPAFASLADLVSKLDREPETRTRLYDLLTYLVDEANNEPAFAVALTTLADQVQTFLDEVNLVPIAHVLGAAMDPQTGPMDPQLTLIKKAHDLDSQRALLTILRNLYRPDASGVYPASNLADLLAELNRTRPGQGGDLDATDYRTLLGEVSHFLHDSERGFTRFLDIVKHRGPN